MASSLTLPKLSAAIFSACALFTLAIPFANASAPALVYHPYPGEELTEEQSQNIKDYLEGLSPRQGEIKIKKANATLTVPSTHYFLGAQDARSILEEAWGNPPDDTILGMLFPAGRSPLDHDVWGATIQFSDDGYISDEDANDIDYTDMMSDLKKSQVSDNKWRADNGYDPIDMVGWAETPAYNPDTHKLYWAKEMKFGEAEMNTLNYDIRVLGRRGALVIGFIASMDQLSAIKSTTPSVLNMAHFDEGSTYADYQPGTDKKAAYGIAGLIGGAAIAKKTGILAAILIFGKKFIGLIIVGLIAVGGAVKRFFVKS